MCLLLNGLDLLSCLLLFGFFVNLHHESPHLNFHPISVHNGRDGPFPSGRQSASIGPAPSFIQGPSFCKSIQGAVWTVPSLPCQTATESSHATARSYTKRSTFFLLSMMQGLRQTLSDPALD